MSVLYKALCKAQKKALPCSSYKKQGTNSQHNHKVPSNRDMIPRIILGNNHQKNIKKNNFAVFLILLVPAFFALQISQKTSIKNNRIILETANKKPEKTEMPTTNEVTLALSPKLAGFETSFDITSYQRTQPDTLTVLQSSEKSLVHNVAAIEDKLISANSLKISGNNLKINVRNISRIGKDHIMSGYAALVRGSYVTALEHYDFALNADPENIQALTGKASALHKLRRTDDAKKVYDIILSKEPDNIEALNNLLAIFADFSPEKTIANLLEIEKKAPWFSPAIAQIGLCYSKIGEQQKALYYLDRANQMSPNNILYIYNLGVIYDTMENNELASEQYKKVLKMIGDGENYSISQDSLENIKNRLSFINQ